MTRRDADIAVIGGGSAGLALAYHRLVEGEGPQIVVLEERPGYHHDRTWCFWDFGELTPELDALVRHRWHSWRFSAGGVEIVHQGGAHPYCAIGAGDYYTMVTERIGRSAAVALLNDCRVDSVEAAGDGFLIKSTQGELKCSRVVDTRPPFRNYLYGASEEIVEEVPDGLLGTPVFQVFYGLEIEAAEPLFDPATAGLMTEMKSSSEGLEFVYLLPFSPSSALIELTRFAVRFATPEQLQQECARLVDKICGQVEYSVIHREGAVLPMGLPGSASGRTSWVRAGIAGGALRPATGYAFVRTQRWASRCAAALKAGEPIPGVNESGSFERFLDRLFLDVLSHNPHLSAPIFLNLGKKLTPDCFARFMMEKSGWLDYFKMITAMPALPFLQRFAARAWDT